jgi:hypothetical protein
MKISGFTMVRNAGKYYFPIKEAILSILPIVDEFIVALGNCDADDDTLLQIESIQSPKIKIFHTIWDEQQFKDGNIFKVQTDLALDQCSGDWCFYLQADEVVHEADLQTIKQACLKYFHHLEVEGLLLKYYHFWGDYLHHLPYHGWCKKEIRIIRNDANIRSYKDALSFRKKGEKLQVKLVDAYIYHYGYVRPPFTMTPKKKEQDGMHWGKEKAEAFYQSADLPFDFGNLKKLPIFKGTHPAVMQERMESLNWQAFLSDNQMPKAPRAKFKHEKLKYRVLSQFENWLNRELFSFNNFKMLK